ncbi:MAG: hypothetical protein ACYSYV_07320 [Planctomycetota bacterium]
MGRHFQEERHYPKLVLFILPFILYGYSLTFDYVLDDKLVLSENDFVKRGTAGIWDILTTDCLEGYFGKHICWWAAGTGLCP